MQDADQERRVIADTVRRARVAKGLDKEPAARAAKVSSITWKRIEDAEVVRDGSLGRVLQSLELPDVEAIITGEPSSPLPTVAATAIPAPLEDLSDDELLAELCKRLAMRHKPQHAVPLSLTRSPYPLEQNPGVDGDEEGDQRRQFGSG